MKTKILLLAMAFALPLFTMANNVRVVLNSYNSGTKQLKISLAWDNSWHDGSGQFRDAVWLFVKYKDITNSEWQHAILTTPTSSAINSPPNSATDTLSGSSVKFDVIGKNLSAAPGPVGSRGYMIRRQKGATAAVQNNPEFAGVYNVGMPLTATIVLPSGVTLANPEFRVYAVEMVDIPAGSFYAGDNTSSSMAQGGNYSPTPVFISSEAQITIWSYFSTYTSRIYPATYPKGQAEFYVMKYELSREGYTEFMNTLTRAQQNLYVTGLAGATSGQNAIDVTQGAGINVTIANGSDPVIFSAAAPFKAFNSNYTGYAMSYLDWAGLRPMSFMEYEKACRGPIYPIQYEYAWGTSTYTDVNTNPDVDLNGPNESFSTTVSGPLVTGAPVRCGAFAKAAGSTRLNTGATYYGVMEMSGNAGELTITDETFTSQNGDGYLISTGENNAWNSIKTHVKSGQVSLGILPQNITTNYNVDPYRQVGIRGVIK